MTYLFKLLVASFLVSFTILHLVHAYDQPQVHAQTQVSPKQQIDCDGACNFRCHLASRQKMCHRACGTCCKRCNCVPPGTSGNQEMCPCYAKLTTHGGRHKCP